MPRQWSISGLGSVELALPKIPHSKSPMTGFWMVKVGSCSVSNTLRSFRSSQIQVSWGSPRSHHPRGSVGTTGQLELAKSQECCAWLSGTGGVCPVPVEHWAHRLPEPTGLSGGVAAPKASGTGTPRVPCPVWEGVSGVRVVRGVRVVSGVRTPSGRSAEAPALPGGPRAIPGHAPSGVATPIPGLIWRVWVGPRRRRAGIGGAGRGAEGAGPGAPVPVKRRQRAGRGRQRGRAQVPGGGAAAGHTGQGGTGAMPSPARRPP